MELELNSFPLLKELSHFAMCKKSCTKTQADIFVLNWFPGHVEWAVARGGLVGEGLVVDVAGRGHDEQVPRAVLHEGQSAVPHLAAGDQEVVLRAEHVPREVVDLDKVGGDEREFRLGSGHPDGLDDEIVGVELRVQNEVLGDGPRAVERQDVAVLESGDGEVVLVDRVGEDGENREWDGGRRQPVECTAFIRTAEVRNLILI